MDWAIFWTALTAIGELLAAGATVWVVIVALRQGKSASEQFLQARYDDARPILIVTSDAGKINIEDDHPTWLNWGAQRQSITVRNVGKGVALHVRSVIYGPESLVDRRIAGQPRVVESAKDYHWYYWRADSLRADEGEKELEHGRDGIQFKKQIENKKTGKQVKTYPLNAPAQPFDDFSKLDPEPTCICRVCITYDDIFHRKHASIFDLVHNYGWQEVATLEDIPDDLQNLRQIG